MVYIYCFKLDINILNALTIYILYLEPIYSPVLKQYQSAVLTEKADRSSLSKSLSSVNTYNTPERGNFAKY